MGSLFLYLGISDFINPESTEVSRPGLDGEEHTGPAPYEKLILGLIMFIPGSYHSFIAFMTWLDQEDYSYKDVATFESDDFFDDNE